VLLKNAAFLVGSLFVAGIKAHVGVQRVPEILALRLRQVLGGHVPEPSLVVPVAEARTRVEVVVPLPPLLAQLALARRGVPQERLPPVGLRVYFELLRLLL